MEIKIGIEETPRELVISSDKTADDVEKLVAEALNGDEGILRLSDDKGRKFVVPAGKIAYVEIAPAESRKVGFGVSG